MINFKSQYSDLTIIMKDGFYGPMSLWKGGNFFTTLQHLWIPHCWVPLWLYWITIWNHISLFDGIIVSVISFGIQCGIMFLRFVMVVLVISVSTLIIIVLWSHTFTVTVSYFIIQLVIILSHFFRSPSFFRSFDFLHWVRFLGLSKNQTSFFTSFSQSYLLTTYLLP